MSRDVFHAIANPTRREIIQLLARNPLNLKSIVDHFDMSRLAVSKHIKALNECKLIHVYFDILCI